MNNPESRQKPLNDQQLAFAKHFVAVDNRTQAAIAAGYSRKSAGKIGSVLAKHPLIKEEIARLRAKTVKPLDISVDSIVREMGAIGFAKVTDIFLDDGGVRPLSEWPDEVHRAIKGIEWGYIPEKRGKGGNILQRSRTYLKKVTFHDKRPALERLGEYLRMWSQGPQDQQNEANLMKTLLKRIGEKNVTPSHGGVPSPDIAEEVSDVDLDADVIDV